jgi:SAM-dependent methyltransferase
MQAMTSREIELERIRAAYRERDSDGAASGPPARSAWSDPGYRFYMQALEWEMLAALDRAGARLAGGRVLEVGCGSGYFLHRLREYGAAHAAGIDLMDDRIAAARERYPTLELVAGDASRLPWEDASFDVVAQITCLSSVLDATLRAEIAADMWRVLRPGGAILSYDMRPIPRVLGALRGWRARRAGPAGGPVTPTTPIGVDELRRMWPAGDVRCRTVGVLPELAALAGTARWIANVAALVPPVRTHLMATVGKPS